MTTFSKFDTLEQTSPSPLSLLFTEKQNMEGVELSDYQMPSLTSLQYYGKLNPTGDYILPNAEKMVKCENFMVLNFVESMYTNFKNYMKSAYLAGMLDDSNKRIPFLSLSLGEYVHPLQSYEQHLQELSDTIIYRIRNQPTINSDTSEQIKNVRTFENFMEFLKIDMFSTHIIKNIPVTLYNFLKSDKVSPISTGAFLDIDEHDVNDEEYKKEMYYENRNFQFYVASAYKFGFRVCKEIPWRLVVDFFSPYTSKAYHGKNKQGIDTVFEICYVNIVHNVKKSVQFLVNTFNKHIEQNKHLICGIAKPTSIQEYEHKMFELFTELYCREQNITDVKIELNKRKVKKLYKVLDKMKLENYIVQQLVHEC